MPRLYMVTVPGLKVPTDWATIHDRLLDDCTDVIDVLPTTMSATLLIAYDGDANVDAWLGGISDGIRSRRARVGNPPPTQTQTRGQDRRRACGLRRSTATARDPALASPAANPRGPQLVEPSSQP
jgi:hypothetical protein